MSTGKGGSSTTSVQLPQYIDDAAQQALAQAERAAQIGFIPYTGPTVAAFTPQQEAAFATTQQAAGAFGLPTATGTGLPEPTTFAGGVQGYSPIPLYEEALAELALTSPGQLAAIESFFIDPVTGAPPTGGTTTGAPSVGVDPITGIPGLLDDDINRSVPASTAPPSTSVAEPALDIFSGSFFEGLI